MLIFPFGLRSGDLGMSLEADRAFEDLVFKYQRKQLEPYLQAYESLLTKQLPEQVSKQLNSISDKFWIQSYSIHEMAPQIAHFQQKLPDDGIISRFNAAEFIKAFDLVTLQLCLKERSDAKIGGIQTKHGVLAAVSLLAANDFVFLIQENRIVAAKMRRGKINIRDELRVLDLKTGEMTATSFCKFKTLPPELKEAASALLKGYRSALKSTGINFLTRKKISQFDEAD